MMKKTILTLSLLCGLVVFTACNDQTQSDTSNVAESNSIVLESNDESSSNGIENADSSEASTASVRQEVAAYMLADYFPNTDNSLYTYEGTGSEYAGFTVYTTYSEENRKQFTEDNGGTVAVSLLEIRDGQVAVLVSQGEVYYRENMLNSDVEATEVLLQAPLATGTTWELSDGQIRTITAIDETVETNAGVFNTIVVTTTGENYTTEEYYAPNTGLVKFVYISADGQEITSELSKVETQVPLTQTVRFYYPHLDGEHLAYEDKEIEFYTDDVTKVKLEEAYKEKPNDSLGEVLPEAAFINILYLNEDGRVYVDFSEELVSDMNAGAQYETMILQSIVNTVGRYYNVEEVMLTVENQPYSSGHIEKQEGEFFTVDYSDVMEAE